MTAGALPMKMDFQLQVVEARDMLQLDYISCALTIVPTVQVGRKMWYGWIVAGVNNLLICFIGALAHGPISSDSFRPTSSA